MSLIKFIWGYGGKNVLLSGSFSNWTSIPMVKNNQNIWTLSISLPHGRHQYKYIVDGHWCYDHRKPHTDDGKSNINNFLDICTTKSVGQLGSPEHRVYFVCENILVSPFHDVPLWFDKENGIFNMIVEIPKGTRAKLEISKNDVLNPIKQDVKAGKLRYVHDPYPFNYGAFPQTWENPAFHDERTNAKGDNDPLDVCDISTTPKKTGDVIQVKVLGVYAMIDSGETDWKIIAIDINDPDSNKYYHHTDIPLEKLNGIFKFLRDYKIPDGNPPNVFAFGGKIKDKDFALKIIGETHEEWWKLYSGKIKTDIKLGVKDQGVAENVVLDQFVKYLQSKEQQ